MRTCTPLRMACSCFGFAHTANHNRGTDTGARANAGKSFFNLDREFAGGTEDQRQRFTAMGLATQ